MDQRTYRFFTGTPLYPFGFGLSYTTFAYSSAKLSSTDLTAGQPLVVTAQVRNTGSREGDETVEFYLVPKHIDGAPLRSLIAFEKIHLKPGESAPIQTTISPRNLSLVSSDGARTIQPGDYDLYIGGNQPSESSGLTLPFHITGSSPVTP